MTSYQQLGKVQCLMGIITTCEQNDRQTRLKTYQRQWYIQDLPIGGGPKNGVITNYFPTPPKKLHEIGLRGSASLARSWINLLKVLRDVPFEADVHSDECDPNSDDDTTDRHQRPHQRICGIKTKLHD